MIRTLVKTNSSDEKEFEIKYDIFEVCIVSCHHFNFHLNLENDEKT